MAPARKVLQIFLSYPSTLSAWVENFTAKQWFGRPLRNPIIDNYEGSPINFGDLEEGLARKIQMADVFVAFIDQDYKERWATVAEFKEAVRRFSGDQVSQRRHLFIAVIVDERGREWWQLQADENHEMKSWAPGYAYADFVGPNGTDPLEITSRGRTNDDVTRLIVKLARQVNEYFSVGPQSSLVVSDKRPIVVLGNPGSASDSTVKPRKDLKAELDVRHLEADEWPDQWRSQAAPAPTDVSMLVGRKPIFVQPVDGASADFHLDEPQLLRSQLLRAAGIEGNVEPQVNQTFDQCQRVIWLPNEINHERFAERAAGSKTLSGSSNPVFLKETPAGVAQLIAKILGIGRCAPIISLEWILEPRLARELVKSTLVDIVSKGVKNSCEPSTPDVWYFEGSQLKDNLRKLAEKGRGILALHDLTIANLAAPDDAEKIVQQKFRQYQSSIDEILDTLNFSTENIMQIALILRYYDQFPWVSFPDAFALQKWRLLRIQVKDGRLQADPGTLEIIRREVAELVAD